MKEIFLLSIVSEKVIYVNLKSVSKDKQSNRGLLGSVYEQDNGGSLCAVIM